MTSGSLYPESNTKRDEIIHRHRRDVRVVPCHLTEKPRWVSMQMKNPVAKPMKYDSKRRAFLPVLQKKDIDVLDQMW